MEPYKDDKNPLNDLAEAIVFAFFALGASVAVICALLLAMAVVSKIVDAIPPM